MYDLLLPVVVVHGIDSGENKDRTGFSSVLSGNVDEVSRPVPRVGPFEGIEKINATIDSSQSKSVLAFMNYARGGKNNYHHADRVLFTPYVSSRINLP